MKRSVGMIPSPRLIDVIIGSSTNGHNIIQIVEGVHVLPKCRLYGLNAVYLLLIQVFSTPVKMYHSSCNS
jgi:hypothetical protein